MNAKQNNHNCVNEMIQEYLYGYNFILWLSVKKKQFYPITQLFIFN